MIGNYVLQEFKNNPVFLITEEDLKQASLLTESFTPSKKDRKEAERRKKTTGVFRQRERFGARILAPVFLCRVCCAFSLCVCELSPGNPVLKTCLLGELIS